MSCLYNVIWCGTRSGHGYCSEMCRGINQANLPAQRERPAPESPDEVLELKAKLAAAERERDAWKQESDRTLAAKSKLGEMANSYLDLCGALAHAGQIQEEAVAKAVADERARCLAHFRRRHGTALISFLEEDIASGRPAP